MTNYFYFYLTTSLAASLASGSISFLCAVLHATFEPEPGHWVYELGYRSSQLAVGLAIAFTVSLCVGVVFDWY